MDTVKKTSIFTKIKNFFNEKVFSRHTGLKTLVALQLKDKLNFSFKADKKGALIKLSLYLLLIVVLTAIITVVFYLFGMLSVFGVAGYVPISIFNFFFFLIFILSTLSCTIRLTNSLYFSKDNQVLLSYPVRANTTFLSKLIVFYILELVKSFSSMVPLFLAYGIANGFSWFYYPWLLFVFFFVAALPVAIGSFLSVPVMGVKMLLRKNPLVQDILIVLVLIALTVLIFIGINAIPNDMHFIKDWKEKYCPGLLSFTYNLQIWLLPLFYLSELMMGCKLGNENPKIIQLFSNETGMIFGSVVGAILVLLILSYLIAKPLFFVIAVKPFEYNKKIIRHNFLIGKSELKEVTDTIYVPVLDKELSKKDRKNLLHKLQNSLKHIYIDKALITDTKLSQKDYINMLEKYSGYQIQTITTEEYVKANNIGFYVEHIGDTDELVLAEKVGISYVKSYDPKYLPKHNHHRTAFISSMWKDILVDIRTPGTLVGNYLLFISGPIAISLLNKIFDAINTNYLGDQLCITFSMLILLMIPLASNALMASVYSREGESSYLLKVSPANYIKTLTTKLVIRCVIVSISILAAVLCYNFYSHISYTNPVLIFGTVEFIYLGHLLWSAELDFMRPMDRLYSEVGEGTVSNPNETTAALIGAVVTVLMTAITFFLVSESIITVYIKLFLIATLFLVARVLLFVLKIKGYRTSRGERGRD